METKKSEIKQIVKTKSLLDSLLKKRTANKVKTSENKTDNIIIKDGD